MCDLRGAEIADVDRSHDQFTCLRAGISALSAATLATDPERGQCHHAYRETEGERGIRKKVLFGRHHRVEHTTR